MALEPKITEIKFAVGVDESTNKEGAPQGFLALENWVYRDADSVSRRNGFKRVASWTQVNERGLVVAGKSLGVVSGNEILPYDVSQGGLLATLFRPGSTSADHRTISLMWGGARIDHTDHAFLTIAGTRFLCVVWTQMTQGPTTDYQGLALWESVWRVINYDTGVVLLEGTLGSSPQTRQIRVVPSNSGTGFMMVYVVDDGAGNPLELELTAINMNTTPPQIQGTSTITADLKNYAFDICASSTGWWVAYAQSSDDKIKVWQFSGISAVASRVLLAESTGELFALAHIAATSVVAVVSISPASDLDMQLVPDDMSSDGTTVTVATGTGSLDLKRLGVVEDAGSRIFVVAGAFEAKLRQWMVDSFGSVTAFPVLENTNLLSRPFRADAQGAGVNSSRIAVMASAGNPFDAAGYRSAFVLALTSGSLSTANTSINGNPAGAPMAVVAFDETAPTLSSSAVEVSVLSSVPTIDTYKRALVLPVDIEPADSQAIARGLRVDHRARSVEIDFGGTTVPAAVTLGDVGFLSGSLVRAFDGTYAGEAAFLDAPDAPVPVGGAAGALTGTYSYVVVFEFTDAHGNLQVSPPSPVGSITVGADKIDVTVAVHSHTFRSTSIPNAQARQLRVKLYRTAAGGSTFNLVRAFTAEPNTSFTYVDNALDAVVGAAEALYTTGGVLESEPAPPLVHMVAHRNRLVGIRSDDPRTIAFTQETFAPFYPRWHSALTFRVDNSGGDPTAVASMDDKILIFQRDQICAVVGSGPDSLGNGAFAQPEVVARGVGVDASNRNSVVVVPDGVMFRHKSGIFLLTRDLQVVPIGQPIQRTLGSGAILSARHLHSLHQVWFCVSGSAALLVFDTRYGRWYTFTAGWFAPRDVAEVDGTVYVLDADGNSANAAQLFKYDTASFVDKLDGTTPTYFAPKIGTPWFRGARRGGTQRLWKCSLNGEVVLGTGISVTLDAFSQRPGQRSDKDPETRDSRHTWSTAQVGSFPDGGFELVGRTVTQRCSAFRCDITVTPSNTDSEGLRLTALSYEYGVEPSRGKAPLAKKPAAS